MATSRARSSDIKLIVSATIAVVLAGLFIAGGLLIATSSGSKNPVCGQLNVGKAADVRDRLDTQGPGFHTGGANCGFWLALDNGDIVAYRVSQPSGCSLNLRDRGTQWVCGDQRGRRRRPRHLPGQHPDDRPDRRGDRRPRADAGATTTTT